MRATQAPCFVMLVFTLVVTVPQQGNVGAQELLPDVCYPYQVTGSSGSGGTYDRMNWDGTRNTWVYSGLYTMAYACPRSSPEGTSACRICIQTAYYESTTGDCDCRSKTVALCRSKTVAPVDRSYLGSHPGVYFSG
jgi:hypothetical protein